MNAAHRDRGAVDVSLQMLFGCMVLLMTLLLVFDSTAYWHARNVFDDAAAEGARVAAAYDGSCPAGVRAARSMIATHAGRWGAGATVTCTEGAVVTVVVSGRTPGVLGSTLGFRARVAESAPKEG
jgi:Flp pilus assembly protein TadG